jgi:1-acyl-sn-glycerol-3-phosphate acyltransferase
MNFFRNILGRIFAFWAMLVFAGSLLVIFIPVWIISYMPEPRRTIAVFRVFRGWMKFFFVFAGVRRILRGRENFKKGINYVVVCNHRSFMDVPLTSPGIPGANKTIAKIEMSRIPLFGMIYKGGSVLVDRKSEESRRNSYLRMKEVLSMGLHMCIYPEGTRNKTSEPLQKFHDGAFRLAVESGKDIIPAIIRGTAEVLPTKKTFFFWPRPVSMTFLPAISSQGKTVQQLKDEVFEVMHREIVNREFHAKTQRG